MPWLIAALIAVVVLGCAFFALAAYRAATENPRAELKHLQYEKRPPLSGWEKDEIRDRFGAYPGPHVHEPRSPQWTHSRSSRSSSSRSSS